MIALGGNLWKHRDFMRFWAGDSITELTGQVTLLALPTVAILTLQVTAIQLGTLNALGYIAFPILGLFVGVWMDRVRRKRVMIVANLAQVATLVTVPLASALGLLSLYQLYAVALVMGTSTLFFEIAHQSYIPSLVDKADVLEANQKLQTSISGAQVAGPSVASALMQLLSAAASLTLDAIGTLIGTVALISIKKEESDPRHDPQDKRHFFTEMKEGIRVITGNKLLWTQAGCTATWNLGGNIFLTAFFIYAYRVLGVSQNFIGVAFSIGALGFLFGALASASVTLRVGLGKAILLSTFCNFGLLISLLATGTSAVLVLGAALFVKYFGTPIYNINQMSLRQVITPNNLQGRTNATMRTIVWGAIPAGSFLGGLLSAGLGTAPAIVIGSLIAGASSLWIVFGLIFKLTKLPEPASD